MTASYSTPVRIAIVLLIAAMAGCGGDSSPNDSGSTGVADTSATNEALTPSVSDDGVAADNTADNLSNELNELENGSPDIFEDAEEPQAPIVAEPVQPIGPNPVVADPLVQNLTRVVFDIEVPAYQSDALQVRLVWGELDITAGWVGDEFWSVSQDLPTDTVNQLMVTFSDNNGEVTLASFEEDFRTGTNASETLQISVDQFDADRWDADGDGVSNLDELIAGTDAFGLPRLLLFSETRGFRHESIADALTAIEELAASNGMQTERAGDSAGVFTEEMLASYDTVVWVLTSGDVLDDAEQVAFENYIRAGGGYVGIHAASDTEYDWPWYGDLVGAYFERHPEIQPATMNVEDGNHPSTAHLGATWTRTDEWYDFQSNPRTRVNILLTLDENSYSGGGMGADHPIAWFHDFDGGRSWYTGGGHTNESYAEADFRAHLLGGIRYAVGN